MPSVSDIRTWISIYLLVSNGTNEAPRLKCNREKPCQNCVVRGESTANSCTYAEKAEGKVSRLNSELKAEYMRNRINRLENSILSMISSDSRDKLSQSTTAHIPILSPQVESENNDQDDPLTTSVDSRSTHWDVILNDVCMKSWSPQILQLGSNFDLV